MIVNVLQNRVKVIEVKKQEDNGLIKSRSVCPGGMRYILYSRATIKTIEDEIAGTLARIMFFHCEVSEAIFHLMFVSARTEDCKEKR